ncbi:hypothetical protein BHE74_00059507, partial [Ensete ventricosum]
IQKLARDWNEEEEGGTWWRKGAPAVRWSTGGERRRPAVKIRVEIGRGLVDEGRSSGDTASGGRNPNQDSVDPTGMRLTGDGHLVRPCNGLGLMWVCCRRHDSRGAPPRKLQG